MREYTYADAVVSRVNSLAIEAIELREKAARLDARIRAIINDSGIDRDDLNRLRADALYEKADTGHNYVEGERLANLAASLLPDTK